MRLYIDFIFFNIFAQLIFLGDQNGCCRGCSEQCQSVEGVASSPITDELLSVSCCTSRRPAFKTLGEGGEFENAGVVEQVCSSSS